jgi:glycosyltransferase involved in cell wall biosynthesis
VKIAHLVTGGEAGGGQIVALDLATAARSRGDDVFFVSPSHGPFAKRVEQAGLVVVILDVGRLRRPWGIVRLARLLRSRRVDVLHTHTPAIANVLARVAGRLGGAAVVTHIHSENYFHPRRPLARYVQRTLDTLSVGLAARVLVVSDATRATLVRQGYPERLLETVHNGIDLTTLPDTDGELRAAFGIPADAFVAGEVARLCDMKGQRHLIAAAAAVPHLHVVLVGDDIEQGGKYKAELQAEAEALDVANRVHFAGHRDDAFAAIAAFDVLVLPSSTEGLPIVVLEAMALEKPVVATPVGGVPELVIDGETGILVPWGDAEALARALHSLSTDRARGLRLGHAGRLRVGEEFTAEGMRRRVLEVYDALA